MGGWQTSVEDFLAASQETKIETTEHDFPRPGSVSSAQHASMPKQTSFLTSKFSIFAKFTVFTVFWKHGITIWTSDSAFPTSNKSM